jgi:hypothetical protein
MAKGLVSGNYMDKPKKKRKGVHAKTKQSKSKGSQHYKKPYRGQGKR